MITIRIHTANQILCSRGHTTNNFEFRQFFFFNFKTTLYNFTYNVHIIL